MSTTRRLVVLLFVVLNTGCATLTTAAISGGDRQAVAAAASVDAAFLGYFSSAGLHKRMRERASQQQHVYQRQVVVVHVHNHLPGSADAPEAAAATEERRRQEPRTPPPNPQQRSREQVRAVIVSRMHELQQCQSLLPPAIGSSYRAYSRFRIQPDGHPVGIELRVHEPKALRDCVEEVIGQWRFPEASMSTSVRLPLAWPMSSSPLSEPAMNSRY